MSLLAPLKPYLAPIKPYLLWIKLGVAAIVLLGALRGGCAWQEHRDQEKIDKMQTKLDNAAASLRAAGNAIRAVNAEADRRIRAASDAAKLNEKAIEEARREGEASARRRLAIDRDVEAAKRRDPNCRKQLELPTCATLH